MKVIYFEVDSLIGLLIGISTVVFAQNKREVHSDECEKLHLKYKA